MSNIEISKINIDETQLLIKDAQNRQDLTSLSTEVQSISTDLNSLSASISTNYLPLSGGTLTGRLNINLSDTFINLIANNVDATTTPDSNKYENIIFSDKNNLRLSGIETTYRTNEKIDIKLLAYNQISGGSNYFIIGRTAEGEDTYSVASPANFCNAINAVNKSGDTMTGELEIQEDGIHLKKSGADISASSISNNQYTAISMTDVNDRLMGYIQGVNYTNGKTSMQLGARKYINNANVDNILKIEVDASGIKTVSVSDSKIWRNALGASDGVWPIKLGGTGQTDIITTTGTRNSGATKGTINIYKWGKFVNIIADPVIYLTTAVGAGESATIGTIPSGYRPKHDIRDVGGSYNNKGDIVISTAGVISFTGNGTAKAAIHNIYFNITYVID